MKTNTNDSKKTDILDSQEFYEIMYSYRHADMTNQELVIKRFEEVKDWIRKQLINELNKQK